MSADAGTRQDVHYGYTRQGEPEVCSRENNGLLSELGRKHLLGSGVGKRYKVRNVKNQSSGSARVLARWRWLPSSVRAIFPLRDLSNHPRRDIPGLIPFHPSIYPTSLRLVATRTGDQYVVLLIRSVFASTSNLAIRPQWL
jgi:hypothetical protein